MSELHGRPHNQEQPDEEPLVQYEDLEQATGFTQVSNAVLRCYPELSDGEKMTYAVLKSFAYVGRETFVGEQTLARARDITVSTVSRHLSRLIEVGLVKVRRRGQGKTNIWIITRIPRDKLEEYIRDWRPKLDLQNPQTKTAQNPQIKNGQNDQVKTAQNPQLEEQESEEPSSENTRGSAPTDSSSWGEDTRENGLAEDEKRPYSHLRRIVENHGGCDLEFSTTVESVEALASTAAAYFEVPDERASIERFLSGYDPPIVAAALDSVAQRLERGQAIAKPVAYFYTVVKVMQAERDTDAAERRRGEDERLATARNWARSLLREWSPHQVRAILADTYHSPTFVDEVLDGLLNDRGG
ncbi:MAG: helix-turn-helix domain-containing protein [Armatimonadota bacterium]|nr:helix-turn-helix domain-containing protein [Armatimonadota bacterium]